VTPTAVAAHIDLDAVFKALASRHRREILRMLSVADDEAAKTCCAADEVCSCKIAERLALSPSTTSHHMSVLRDAGLVSGRKDGTWTYYTLKRDALAAAAEVLTDL
jgi:ArsR family transcriptional regulator, arsenate/arsenite/antimonite-responsive transcriptional repressor